ncbi:unnamed protein product [Caenorhabditis nigoni]
MVNSNQPLLDNNFSELKIFEESTTPSDQKMKPDFRLMDLYSLEQRTMLRNWTLDQQISYSLCSTKCKNLIQSLKQKITFYFFVSKQLEIQFYGENNKSTRAKIEYFPEKQEIKFSSLENRDVHFELKFELSLKEFLEHLRTLYGCTEPEMMFEEQLEGLDMVQLKNAMSGFKISNIVFLNTATSASVSQGLDFYSSPKILSLAVNRNDPPLREFFSGFNGTKFEIVKIMEYPAREFSFIPIINSKYIDIDCPQYSPSMFNEVLKRWIESEESPSEDYLEALYLRGRKRDLPVDYEQMTMQGIEFQREPLQKQPYDVPHDQGLWELSNEMHARFGIRRSSDGKKATVIIDSFKNGIFFKLIIGH